MVVVVVVVVAYTHTRVMIVLDVSLFTETLCNCTELFFFVFGLYAANNAGSNSGAVHQRQPRFTIDDVVVDERLMCECVCVCL